MLSCRVKKIVYRGVNYFLSYYYFLIFSWCGNVSIGKNLVVKGVPIIDIDSMSKLIVGDDVMLNSQNLDYHVNMFSPVKLFADRRDAVIKIGDKTRIHGSCIHAYERIEIGSNCLIAANCQIFDGSGHDLSFDCVENRIKTKGASRPICIGNNVWLGTGVIVLPGVVIGDGSVIGANSVVSKNIPSMVLAAGNPAVVIKEF